MGFDLLRSVAASADGVSSRAVLHRHLPKRSRAKRRYRPQS